MPFKSEAQRKKFIVLEKQGKLKPGTVKAWEEETPAQLPKRVGKSAKISPTSTSYTKKRFSR